MDESTFRNLLETASSSMDKSEAIIPIESLEHKSLEKAFILGTGLSITRHICERMLTAKSEIIFVTCFWSRSKSLDILCDTLRKLNARCASLNTPIRIRIAFSSYSLAQKLFHSSSKFGQNWSKDLWNKQLGLPNPSELHNLDIQITSMFFRPLSVLHCKFCIIDRAVVMLPSSNVSWENWLECCTSMEGTIVSGFVNLWARVWEFQPSEHVTDVSQSDPSPRVAEDAWKGCPVVLLPQPFHQNPNVPYLGRLSFLWSPLGYRSVFPPSPQNIFILQTISSASSRIFIQTPNINCNILLTALERALARGITVDIVTCKRMMVLEQLVTALQTTECCINRLIKYALQLRSRSETSDLLERGESIGRLRVRTFKPRSLDGDMDEEDTNDARQSHVKAMVVDGSISILGSANCDRASWFTSMEVNVALLDVDFAEEVEEKLMLALGRNLRTLCDIA